MLSKLAETVIGARTGDGVVPQLIEKAHIKKRFILADPAYLRPQRCKRYNSEPFMSYLLKTEGLKVENFVGPRRIITVGCNQNWE